MHLTRSALLATILALPAATATAEILPPPGPALVLDAREDHRLDRFAADLARNLRGVWQGDTLGPLALGSAFALATSSADGAAIRYFDRHPMGTFGRVGEWSGSGQTMAALTGGLLIAGQIAPEGRFRAATYDMAQAGIVNAAYTYAVKKAVGRDRPNGANRLSFPSGHTSNAVAAAVVWAHHYPKAAVPVYAAAGLIGASRVARGAHHVSDVIAGATVGYVVGRTVVRGSRPLGRDGALLTVGANGGPSGDGMGLSLAVGF
jgi:membrane-associated phospholipid phosphatase